MKRNILKTYADVLNWFLNNDLSTFAVDTELADTSWLNMCIAGISFCDGDNVCYIDLFNNPDQEDILTYLHDFVFDTVGKLIFHNAPFDLKVLKKYNLLDYHNNIFCTMTAAHLLDENQRKSLKFLAGKYLGVKDTIDFEEAITQGFHSEKFYNYATNDAVWTYQLWEIFKEGLKEQHLEDLFYNTEMPFQWCLRDLSINGIKVDKDELLKLQEQMIAAIADLQVRMYEAGNIGYVEQQLTGGGVELIPDINLNSPKQLVKLIRQDLGIKLTEKTKDGNYTTKNSVLEGIKDKHKFIELLLEYRSVSKMLNSFLIPLPEIIDDDNRIRVDFRNTVAVTGRVSASRVHQLPKDNTGPVPIRQCFVPEEGKVLLCADYAGQELRVLAHVSKEDTMLQAFRDKVDVHFLIANIFFDLGIPNECLVETHPKYKKYRKKYKAERDKIKTVNFGLAYGKTEYGFAKDWNIPEKEAKAFIDGYFARFPKIKDAIDACRLLVLQQKAIRNLTGRIRRFQYIDDYGRAIRQAFNFLVQGPSADMMKKAAGDFRKIYKQHPEWGCLFVLTVHDELVYEVNKEYADEAKAALKDCMENAVKLRIPIVADVRIGNNYQEAKV